MTVAQAIDRTDVGYLCRSPSSDVRDGVVAMAPFVVGLAPFALTIGAAAARSDDPLAGWSALIGVGVVAGGRLDSIDLDVMVPLCLVALVAPALRDATNRLPMIAAAAVALGGPWLPSGATMLLAIVAGTVAGAAAGDGDAGGSAR